LDIFVYSRDAAGTEALRGDAGLLERHWSYMDAFADSMIARGPTFLADGATVTGSLHVLGLPGVEAVREFVAREPNNRAGVYGEHLVRRFENMLGRTMWEFPGTAAGPKFLVLARSHRTPAPPGSLPRRLRARLILDGALSTLDTAEPAGVVLAVQARDEAELAALLEAAGLEREAAGLEIHAWEFGGRR
jgi:hypothetical protein